MPTRRATTGTTGGSDRQAAAVTLLGLSIPVQLDLMSGWLPPRGEFEASRPTFHSYREYLDTYRAVRAEMFAKWPADGPTWFCERLHLAALARPRVDVEKLGAALYRRRYGGV
jgi:hypothetical protein